MVISAFPPPRRQAGKMFPITRKLVTGSKFDVNFDDLKKSYGFGIALFDNAQVRHAMVEEPLVLQFK
jgi:hypothetical protein